MAYQFIFVPVPNSAQAEEALNLCLVQKRVLAVTKHFVSGPEQTGWSFCLEYALGSGPLPEVLKVDGYQVAKKSGDIDYREVLNQVDFAAYAALRSLRKEIAAKEGVPLFAVLTNEQLAQMVLQKVRNKDMMGKIEGIGKGRLDKYAEAMLTCLHQMQDKQ